MRDATPARVVPQVRGAEVAKPGWITTDPAGWLRLRFSSAFRRVSPDSECEGGVVDAHTPAERVSVHATVVVQARAAGRGGWRGWGLRLGPAVPAERR